MAETTVKKETLKVGVGVVMMFVAPDNRVMVFSGGEENSKKTGEMVMGLSSGVYRSVLGFELPGGVVERGESKTEAIKREVREEVGYGIDELINENRLKMGDQVRLLQKRNGEPDKFDVEVYQARISWEEVEELLEKLPEGKEALFLSKREIENGSLDHLRERDRMILKNSATILG